MNRREKLEALAKLHARTSQTYADTVPAGDGELDHGLWNLELHGSAAADREYFTEARRILGRPTLAASGVSLGSDADREAVEMSFHKEMDNPECEGQIAVVDDDTSEVDSCHADEAGADEALARLNATEPTKKPMLEEKMAVDDEPYDFEGPLVVEGLVSGDGRKIDRGALSWRELPVPLMLQTVNPESGGHSGAVVAGSIHEIERVGDEIIGRGRFDSGSTGQEARRLLTEGTMRGVSVDLDMTAVEWRDADDVAVEVDPIDAIMGGSPQATMAIVEGRIMGATLTPFPAFQEAYLEVLRPVDVIVASAHPARWHQPLMRDALDALVAAASKVDFAIPVAPPTAWFSASEPTALTPLRVTAEGQVYGHVAAWGSCHIGFGSRCVSVPKSRDNYRHFRTGQVLTAEGTLVNTGPLYLDGGHAPLDLSAQGAKDWMADVCSAVADVAVYEDRHGVFVAGALRPTATPELVRALRGSDVSPDWRNINGNLEMVGLVAVNTSGFIVPPLVASGRWALDTEQPTALVAAGVVRHDSVQARLADTQARLAKVEEFVLGLRAEKVKKRFADAACACSTVRVKPEELEFTVGMVTCSECGAEAASDAK